MNILSEETKYINQKNLVVKYKLGTFFLYIGHIATTRPSFVALKKFPYLK